MSFPLFGRPSAVVFLDDDPAYLDMLGMVLPADWQVELFLRPQACVAWLRQQPALWETDAWQQQQIVERWRAGSALVPQVLHYWSASAQRLGWAGVCVADYSMPGMDGLQMLGGLVDWPGARILLTGQADEQVAVTAFNHAIIDKFIPKQSPQAARDLVDAVGRFLIRPHPRHEQIWRNTLSAEQASLLRDPAISRDLQALVNHRWIEHIAIGEPFGVLGLDRHGEASWLQLEPDHGLADLAEVAETEGMAPVAVNEIRMGKTLVNLELRQSLAQPGPVQSAPAVALGDAMRLHAAFFSLAGLAETEGLPSYANWLNSCGERSVRD